MNDNVETSANRRYPFPTRAEIRSRIPHDRDFARRCVAIMAGRHTARLAGDTSVTGWGSSDERRIAEPAAHVLSGTATEADWALVNRILPRYAKQLASQLRAEQIERNPDLLAIAAVYGVAPAGKNANEEPSSPDAIEVAITAFLVEHGRGRTGEIVTALQSERQPVVRRLAAMVQRGILTRRGTAGGTHYELAAD